MARFALMILAVILASPPVSAQCIMSYCKNRETTATPTRSYITNQHRQIIGDLYDPGHGRRIQIRDKNRKILGYIERTGKVTDSRRREVGGIEDLGLDKKE